MRGVGSSMLSRGMAALVAIGFLTSLLPLAAANPAVPYCLGSVDPAPGAAGGVVDPAVCEAATSRIFPEALFRPEYALAGNTGYASDYVSFTEFQAAIRLLAQRHPDKMEIHTVGQSYGLQPTPGAARDRFPIYNIEVTNKKSPIPMDQRLEILFMLSIHGNEKGGREGGMRVLEDLVANKGIARETVQDGAGMPSPLVRPGGGEVKVYGDYLDFMRLHFLFPNADGWMHDELPYASQPLCGTLYCRTNGNGTDLNRQMPTIGWQQVNYNNGRLAVNEPEARGYLHWLINNHTWAYAIDIHGMLNHENFVAIMLPAGSLSPQEMYRSTRLSETLKERLNADDHFNAWTTALGTAQQAGDAAGPVVAPVANQLPPCQQAGVCFGEGSPTTLVGSGEFSDWSTVWDAIGYTDSGFSGDFFAQSSGLNAPGYDIELAYNHITFDSQYEVGAVFNDYHVHAVRHIVKSFMDAAALDVQVSYETHGKKTLVIEPQYVATNLDDVDSDGNPMPTPGGWADANAFDNPWQYSGEKPFRARPAKYWYDLAPFLKDGDRPGVLTLTMADKLTPQLLAQYDNVVIPGSAINQFIAGDAGSNQVAQGEVDAARLKMIVDWVDKGGNLVLTDSALSFLDLSGITSGAVRVTLGYAGAVNFDRSHELVKNVRGEARQTYEPVPLGFRVGFYSPIWGVDPAAFTGKGGDVAGTGYRGNDVSLGILPHGAGRIQLIGALLPDPTEEFYHPYGLDDYATTYSGNQVLRNMLGWTEIFAAPPIVITDAGQVQQSQNERSLPLNANQPTDATGQAGGRTPAPPVEFLLLGALAALGVLRRRLR